MRGVELEVCDVDADRRAALRMSALASVGAHRPAARRDDVQRCALDGVVGERAPPATHIAVVLAGRRTARPEQVAAASARRPTRPRRRAARPRCASAGRAPSTAACASTRPTSRARARSTVGDGAALDDRARRAPRRGARTACGTRGSRRARCTSSSVALPPSDEVAEVDVERRRRARSTITSALLRTLGLVLAARFSRSLGVCSSRLAKMPSRPP